MGTATAPGTLMESGMLEVTAKRALPVGADCLALGVDEVAAGVSLTSGRCAIPEFSVVAVSHIVWKLPEALGARRLAIFAPGAIASGWSGRAGAGTGCALLAPVVGWARGITPQAPVSGWIWGSRAQGTLVPVAVAFGARLEGACSSPWSAWQRLGLIERIEQLRAGMQWRDVVHGTMKRRAVAGRRPRRHGGGLHEQKKKGEGEQGCDTPLVHDTGRGTWGWTVRWYSPSREKGAHLNFDELIVEGSDFVSDGAQQVLVGYGDVVPSASFEFSVPVKTDT